MADDPVLPVNNPTTTPPSPSCARPGFERTRQCRNCPWRRDAPIGHFEPERYAALANTVEQAFGPIFACHKTKGGASQACVGYLKAEGMNNFHVRIAAAKGDFHPRLLVTFGEQYPSFSDMAAANGWKADP